MTDTTQQTLAGDTTAEGRVSPRTFLYCRDCDSRILRSAARDHGLTPVPRWDNESAWGDAEVSADD